MRDDDDELAAKTGVTETTMVPVSYAHPTNRNIRFWDLPGIGTPKFPDLDSFCMQVGIEKYDTFLILSSARFTENDKLLAAKVKSLGKSFFFIRSKIDNDIAAEKRKKKYVEEKVLKQIRDECMDNVQCFDLMEQDVFLISSFKPAKWDFGRLQKAISDKLPTEKKESLILTLHAKSKDVLRDKIQILKGKSVNVKVFDTMHLDGVGQLCMCDLL